MLLLRLLLLISCLLCPLHALHARVRVRSPIFRNAAVHVLNNKLDPSTEHEESKEQLSDDAADDLDADAAA